MSIKVQKSNLYFIDPYDNSVVDVECYTNFSGLSNPASEIDVTCIADDARQWVSGLKEPGSVTFGLNPDDRNDSHIRLKQLEDSGEVLNWALAALEGSAPPTADSDGEFVLPSDRVWWLFSGYVQDFPLEGNMNDVYRSTVTIRQSGKSTWVPRSS